MAGTIFISGGGDEKDSWKIDHKFISILKRKKILYIPIALNRDTLGFEKAYDWLVNCLSQHTEEFVEIVMILDLENISGDFLNQFEAIYLGGGNTYKLLYLMTITGFKAKLIEFYKKGGIIYGGSAGAIVLGRDIRTVEEERKENEQKYIYYKGLKLINNYSIICHFKQNDSNQLNKIKFFIKKYKTEVLALPEGSGLMYYKNKFFLIGDKPIYKFDLKNQKPNLFL